MSVDESIREPKLKKTKTREIISLELAHSSEKYMKVKSFLDKNSPGYVSKYDDIILKMLNYKHDGRDSWLEVLVNMMICLSMRSGNPKTKVGCIVVDDDIKILGSGYNGEVKQTDNIAGDVGEYLSELPEIKFNVDLNVFESKFKVREIVEYESSVHAEMNCLTIGRTSLDFSNSTCFVSLLPCPNCYKMISQLGVKWCIFLADYGKYKETWHWHEKHQSMTRLIPFSIFNYMLDLRINLKYVVRDDLVDFVEDLTGDLSKIFFSKDEHSQYSMLPINLRMYNHAINICYKLMKI
jgi:dCMP deaminase